MQNHLRRNTNNNIGLYILCCLILASGYGNAKLRGIGANFEALRERATNPFIREDIRGKTLQELGVVEPQSKLPGKTTNVARRTEGSPTYSYFAVYDEIGPPFKNLGETAGLLGTVYDNAARNKGIKKEYSVGSLQATCTVVASKGTQLCSYEFFIVDTNGSIGTLVATGSLNMNLNEQHILIIEATGDDYSIYSGGLVGITYTAAGKQYIIDIEIMF